jgi:hypothetical protein
VPRERYDDFLALDAGDAGRHALGLVELKARPAFPMLLDIDFHPYADNSFLTVSIANMQLGADVRDPQTIQYVRRCTQADFMHMLEHVYRIAPTMFVQQNNNVVINIDSRGRSSGNRRRPEGV